MQQTLLVLLGVIILSLYGYSYQARSAADDRISIRRELETAALGVATDWSSRVQRFSFDQKSVGASRPVPSGVFTASSDPATFGAAEHSSSCDWNDVDDFHGFTATEAYPVRYGEADFAVEIGVRYADPDDLAQTVALSNVKVATITATYVEPVADTTAWAFKPPVRVSLDVTLSNSVLTVQQEMRRFETSRPGSASGAPDEMTGRLIFSGC